MHKTKLCLVIATWILAVITIYGSFHAKLTSPVYLTAWAVATMLWALIALLSEKRK